MSEFFFSRTDAGIIERVRGGPGAHPTADVHGLRPDDDDGPARARRRFLADALLIAGACAFAIALRASPRLAGAASARHWLKDVDDLAAGLRQGALDDRAWRQRIDAIDRAQPLSELLPRLDAAPRPRTRRRDRRVQRRNGTASASAPPSATSARLCSR